MRTGYDGEGFPGVAAMRAAGMTFAIRYAVPDHPRGIQAFEVAALESAGFDIVCYYEEQTGAEILQGAPFGVRAANVSQQVLAAVGQHARVCVNLACDLDITPGQVEPVFEALDAFSAIAGRQNAGIYGGVVPVHLARAAGKATYAVQAGAWRDRAESVGVMDPYGWSPYAQVRQDGYNQYLGGVQIDHLTALAGDFGQWKRPGPIITIPPDNSPFDPLQFHRYPTLQMGSTGGYVANVQFILDLALSVKLKVDGVFGHDTYQAVYFWQGLAKRRQTGVVDMGTWDSLGAWVARCHRFDHEPIISFNDVGHPSAVRDLQTALNEVFVPGNTPLTVDGSYGPKVRAAVAQYQRNRHLPVTGATSKQLWFDLGQLVTRRGH